jgi:two-component system nitrate/nitrite response regulator NarL
MNASAQMNDRVDTLRTAKSIRIAVIDGDPIFRRDVVRMLNGVDGIEVVGEGATSADAIRVAKDLRPDVILLDLRLPQGSTEAAASIARACPNVGTIILTDSENELDVALALQAGARGYILSRNSVREVVDTVRAVVRRESRAMPNLASRLLVKDRERINAVVCDNILDFGLSRKSK